MGDRGLDVHMPVLAFMAMMMDQGMPLSEAVQATIDAIPGGDVLDDEMDRAAAWLTVQGKGRLVSRMVRHLCECQEVMESDTHWARLVAVPVVGSAARVALFAERWAQQDLGTLGGSRRVPKDARWVWLPFAFDAQEVDSWRTSQRSWVLQTILDGMDRPERLKDALHLLGQGLTPASPRHEGAISVRVLVGALVSTDRVWLDGGDEHPLLHLGVNIQALTDETLQALRDQGLDTDDDSVQDHFAGYHGIPLDELTEMASDALDDELEQMRDVAAALQVPTVEMQPIYPLAEAVARCTLLGLNLALELDSADHGEIASDFTQAHLSQPSATDPAWVAGVAEHGAVWGPYPLKGVSLWLDQVPDMAQEVFESRTTPDLDSVELVFHDSSRDLPKHGRALH